MREKLFANGEKNLDFRYLPRYSLAILWVGNERKARRAKE